MVHRRRSDRLAYTSDHAAAGIMSGGVSGLVLAAGAGRRFGGPKALAQLDGERLVDRAVRALHDGGVDDVIVVSGATPLEVADAVVVHNPRWSDGMGSSLRAGLDAQPPGSVAAAVVLVDQPGVTASVVRRTTQACRDERSLVQATYDGRAGHPVVIGRAHWSGAAELAVGDRGARDYLGRHADLVVTVECGDLGTDVDVDTAADLAALLTSMPANGRNSDAG